MLRPFFCLYGGKWRSFRHYPAPLHGTVIEPFAGGAGWSLRYHERNIVLVERYHVLAEVWRYLISVRASEVRRVPLVDCVDDLPSWVPDGGRWLVGLRMSNAITGPRRRLSSGLRKLQSLGRKHAGWTEESRNRISEQVEAIRHWRIIEGAEAPAGCNVTTFVDAPYQGAAGRHYPHGSGAIDYAKLAAWVRARDGQTIVCEAEGADWLDFQPLATFKAGPRSQISREVIWLS